MKRIMALLISGLMLSSCAIPGSLVGMNKELEALIKVKDAGAVCVAGHGPPLSGAGSFVSASVDKGIKGTVKVGPDCSIEIETK